MDFYVEKLEAFHFSLVDVHGLINKYTFLSYSSF